ncbi:hypothetical protein [Stutzerimonas nitrititolerans]
MQLTKQERLFLDRMALQMIATGDIDIERAGKAVLAQDKALVRQALDLSPLEVFCGYEMDGQTTIRDRMARSVYQKIKGKSLHMENHV